MCSISSVCPICGSSEVVHLCSAYMEAEAVKARNIMSNPTDGNTEAKNHGPVAGFSDQMTGGMDHDQVAGNDIEENKASAVLNHAESTDKIEDAESLEYPKYVVIYLGSSILDRRFPPQTAMPWVMGEVRRSRDTFKEVQLEVHKSTLNAVAYEGHEQVESVFEHNLHTLSRFAKTHQDPRCFAYLRRQSLYSDFECHVFLTNEESVVSKLLVIYIFYTFNPFPHKDVVLFLAYGCNLLKVSLIEKYRLYIDFRH